MPHRSVSSTHRGFGKVMRQIMTNAEARLWLGLRKPGIAGLRFRRQTPIGPYIVDCPQYQLIVEVDGGQHAYDEEIARDRDRDNWLAEQGYRMVRFWNNDVMTNIEGVCVTISIAAHEAGDATPSRNR
jgi:very-short-patch-repair endonuclease